MLFLNNRLPSQFFFDGNEKPSGEQAKTQERPEAKVDSSAPDTNRPDDFSKLENREQLYYSDAPAAIRELRGVNKNKEADALQRSLDLARSNERDTHTNKEAVAKNIRKQLIAVMNDPLIRAAERRALYTVAAKEAISLLRSQGKNEEAATLERSVTQALENEMGTLLANKLEAARAVRKYVDNALASVTEGPEMDTVRSRVAVAEAGTPIVEQPAQSASAGAGGIVPVHNANVPATVRRMVMAKVDDATPIGTKVEIIVNNTRWVATKVNDRRFDYSKQSA